MANHSKLPKLENHALRRLAHLMVGGEDQNTLFSAHDFIVEQALLDLGKNNNIKEICNKIRELFLLRFSIEEITASIQRLVQMGRVFERTNRFTLSVDREGQLRKENADTKDQEQKIYTHWAKDITKRYSAISSADIQVLLDDLKEYLSKIFLKHGAECSVFIYPEQSQVTELLRSISGGELEKILPDRDVKLKEIRQVEFPAFFQNIDSEKRIFFSKLLDGTFIYSIIQVDPNTVRVLRGRLKNYIFYLDTNVIYALLDLHSPQKASTVEKAFNIARNFGIKFVVTSKTVEEMNRSITLKSKELLETPNIRRDLAQKGAELSEEENFITAYLRSFAKTGITKEDFIEKFKHIPDLLKLKGINIFPEIYAPAPTELEKEKEVLRTSISTKTHNTAEHDAYHILLIRNLRKEAVASSSENEYWFLSFDTQLGLYAQSTRMSGDKPVVYMPHQLLQILRLFEQRTEDYDATFVELFARPQIKFAQNVLPNDLANKILSKISGFADLPREIALKIIVDQKFISTVSDTRDGEKQDEIIKKKIELELTTKVNELVGRVTQLERERTTIVSEKEQVESSSTNSLHKQERQTETFKLALVIVSSLLILTLCYILYTLFWDDLSLTPRLVALSIVLSIFLGISKIKWDIGVTFTHLGTFIGIATAVFLVATFRPAKNQDFVPSTTSVNLEATSIDGNVKVLPI